MGIYTRVLLGLLLTISWSNNSIASDFFSLLDVRYETGLKKTFLAGPFNGKAWCEKLNQNTWDSVQPVCGNCKKEMQFCAEWSQLKEPYQRVFNGERSPFVYVIATKKNRIIFSGASRSAVEQECEATAQNLRASGYADARCVR